MIVHIPTPLRSYTGERPAVDARGNTVGGVLSDLDRRFPGLRFRIVDEADHVRRHIKLFVNQEPTEDLSRAVAAADEVHIICALSGG